MSIEVIKEQIHRFVHSSTPEVLAIRGPWGIGKTFTWNKLIKEEKEQIALERYAYVSLFGINTLKSLKSAIFEQTITKNLVGEEASIKTLSNNTYAVLSSLGRKWAYVIKGIPALNGFATAIDSASFLYIRESIICIDDFERKGKRLDLRDVLGLVSILKEQRKCKVVLIFNDKEFEGNDSKEYEIFREKVIDLELFFDLSPEECCELTFDKDRGLKEKLKEFVSKLKINNIRILKKIERLAIISKEILPNHFESDVLNKIFESLVLFCWCFYSKNPDIPPLDYVKTIGNKMLGLSDNLAREDNKEKHWKAFLREYGYENTDTLQLIIAEAVQSGYFKEEEFLHEANKLNEQFISAKSAQSFSDAWEIYHDSFDNNEKDVIKRIKDSFYNNCNNITPLALDATVRLFRFLSQDTFADELIHHYIKNRSNEIKLFDLSGYIFSSEIKDNVLINSFQQVILETYEEKTLKGVLDSIAQKNSWSQEDEKFLAGIDADQYYDLFKREKRPESQHFNRRLLKI